MEGSILLGLQEIRTPAMTKFMQVITYLGEAGIAAMLVCLLLLVIKKTRQAGIAASVSLACEALITNVILKNLVARVRPYELIEGLEHVAPRMPSDWSFPSGHTGATFAVAFVMLWMLPKRIGVPAVIVASLVAFSRLYLGVHYPTDVLAGIAIASVTSWIGVFISRKLNNHFRKNTESGS